MAWKIERWLTEVCEDEQLLFAQYQALGGRELAIVACATLDIALADLLSARLVLDRHEVEDLLGADEDGRAPVASFGARIQLAYLTGVIPKSTLRALRAIKSVRNYMAHRVRATLLSPVPQRGLDCFRDFVRTKPSTLPPNGQARLRTWASTSRTDEKAAREFLLFCFLVLHYGFREIAAGVKRIEAMR